jgi:hypothetical protein
MRGFVKLRCRRVAGAVAHRVRWATTIAAGKSIWDGSIWDGSLWDGSVWN